MNIAKKIYKVVNSLDKKSFFKLADTLEEAMQNAFGGDISVRKFLHLTDRMNQITQYKIVSLLKILDCSDKEIDNALKMIRRRYNEIMSSESNLKDLIHILQGGSFDVGNRKDSRLDIEHAMEIIENWLIEEAVMPYMNKLSKGSPWELSSFDKDRLLNLSQELEGGADFIDDEGSEYELKTRWGGIGNKIHIKPHAIPKGASDNYHIYFTDVPTFGKNYSNAMPSSFRGSIYDLPISQILKSPMVDVSNWGGKKGYQVDLSQIEPIQSANMRAEHIYKALQQRKDDWTNGPNFLKKHRIKG